MQAAVYTTIQFQPSTGMLFAICNLLESAFNLQPVTILDPEVALLFGRTESKAMDFTYFIRAKIKSNIRCSNVVISSD